MYNTLYYADKSIFGITIIFYLEFIIVKKKLATILILLLSVVTILSGCNLFDTNNYMALSSIVATSGDITITREELITKYNSGGYYYSQIYGLSNEKAFERMIDELIEEKYLLSYIDSKGDEYKLTSQDLCDVISDTWDYIDTGMSTYVKEVRKLFNYSIDDISIDGEETEPEFAVRDVYEAKFELIDGKIAYIKPKDTKEHKISIDTITTEELALSYAKEHYSYRRRIKSDDEDLKTMVWNRYISALKSSQKNYNYADMSDEAVFGREVKRLFDYNLKNAKQTKFEEVSKLESDFTLEDDRYIINSKMLEDMVAYYADIYTSNKDLHDLSSTAFFKALASSSNGSSYFYYGDDGEEKFITCTHILIKLSTDQTDRITEIESDSLYQGKQKTDAIESIKSADNTKAYERSLTTGEVIDQTGISVSELYSQVSRAVNGVTSLQAKVDAFNDFLYRYNVDPGIINAEFDYIVGSEKNSAMVQTFTDLVRELYDNGNGEKGSIGIVYEDGSSYKGYHIVMYTGVLDNIFVSKTDLASLDSTNIYSILSNRMTSLSYGESLFDYVYSKTTTDRFATYKKDVLSTLQSGKTTEYNVGNYRDLFA